MPESFHHASVHNECGRCCTKVQHLSLTLSGEKILQDIDLHLHCGELTAIIGPNGAGKSTLLKALIGQYPISGEITFFDAERDGYSAPRLGYVPQNPAFEKDCPVTVGDLFASVSHYPCFLPRSKRWRKRTEEALSRTGCADLIDKRVGVLSGGQAQRVMLALALTPLPSILLLDEPFSGLDNVNMQSLYELIDRLRTEYDLSIVIVSHDFDYIRRYADKVVLLRHTILASGTPSEVFSSEAYKRVYPMLDNPDAAVERGRDE